MRRCEVSSGRNTALLCHTVDTDRPQCGAVWLFDCGALSIDRGMPSSRVPRCCESRRRQLVSRVLNQDAPIDAQVVAALIVAGVSIILASYNI